MYSKSKKRTFASKPTRELVDWMLAIDYDIAKFPGSVDALLMDI
jgi:hypothetical protein